MLILPAVLVLLVSVFKLPALLGMGITVVVSTVFAMIGQGLGFVELMGYAANGFSIETGAGSIVDNMLNRGGITSMTGLLITFMVASVMGGIITATRANIHYLVTEYGLVNLTGTSTWQRAEKIISIAHPDFRDELIAEAEKMHIWRASNKR